MIKIQVEINEDLNNKLEQYKNKLSIPKNKSLNMILEHISTLDSKVLLDMIIGSFDQVDNTSDHITTYDPDHQYTMEEFKQME